MTVPELETEIRAYWHRLPPEQQRHVLEFVRALVAEQVRGVSGQSLLRFAGTIDANDLTMMAQVIEDGCEHIHGEDW
jgi:hypothetical protein